MQYTELVWRDGQPYSERFDDIYYSSGSDEEISGQGEFDHVFFNRNGLPQRWSAADDFIIAELGFGSGLNCILTMREWLRHLDREQDQKHRCLHYIAIEKYPLSPAAISQLLSRYPDLGACRDALLDVYPPAVSGAHTRHLFGGRVIIHFRFMDAFESLKDENLEVDAWYLDGFSPAKNSAMWSQGLFEKVVQNSRPGTTCSTYTAAGFVRRHLQAAGFTVEKVKGYGRKREMLVGTLESEQLRALRFDDSPWFSPPAKAVFKEKRAIVLGGGIAGLCAAYSMIRRGWQVTLIDDRDAVDKASSNPAAIVYPRLSLDNVIDSDFYIAAHCYATYMLDDLQERYLQEQKLQEHSRASGQRKPFWFACGLLQSGDSKRWQGILHRFHFDPAYIAGHSGVGHGDAGPGDLYGQVDSTDEICAADAMAVNYKTAGVVLPPVLSDALVDICGDRLDIIDAEVSTVIRRGDLWLCQHAEQVLASAEVLVIANGTQVNELALPFGVPVETVRGQVAVLKSKQKTGALKQAINAGVYLTPSIDGQHFLGATYSRDDFRFDADAADNDYLLKQLSGVYPDTFDAVDIDYNWVGFRTMSKDRVPVVGAVPDPGFYNREYADIRHGNKVKHYQPAEHLQGLYISAAHGSRGFTSSFLSGELVASQINGEPAPLTRAVQDHINPSRFIVNDLKRR